MTAMFDLSSSHPDEGIRTSTNGLLDPEMIIVHGSI